MKKLFLPLVLMVCLSSCSKHYEYKQIIIEAKEEKSYYSTDRSSKIVPVSAEKLNSLADEGWELITAYPIIETTYPNFGNSEYVTGIRTNTRTKEVVYIFKKER